jgi:hypothetical protein
MWFRTTRKHPPRWRNKLYPFEPAGPYRPMKRKVALWTFGILAAAIFGAS